MIEDLDELDSAEILIERFDFPSDNPSQKLPNPQILVERDIDSDETCKEVFAYVLHCKEPTDEVKGIQKIAAYAYQLLVEGNYTSDDSDKSSEEEKRQEEDQQGHDGEEGQEQEQEDGETASTKTATSEKQEEWEKKAANLSKEISSLPMALIAFVLEYFIICDNTTSRKVLAKCIRKTITSGKYAKTYQKVLKALITRHILSREGSYFKELDLSLLKHLTVCIDFSFLDFLDLTEVLPRLEPLLVYCADRIGLVDGENILSAHEQAIATLRPWVKISRKNLQHETCSSTAVRSSLLRLSNSDSHGVTDLATSALSDIIPLELRLPLVRTFSGGDKGTLPLWLSMHTFQNVASMSLIRAMAQLLFKTDDEAQDYSEFAEVSLDYVIKLGKARKVQPICLLLTFELFLPIAFTERNAHDIIELVLWNLEEGTSRSVVSVGERVLKGIYQQSCSSQVLSIAKEMPLGVKSRCILYTTILKDCGSKLFLSGN